MVFYLSPNKYHPASIDKTFFSLRSIVIPQFAAFIFIWFWIFSFLNVLWAEFVVFLWFVNHGALCGQQYCAPAPAIADLLLLCLEKCVHLFNYDTIFLLVVAVAPNKGRPQEARIISFRMSPVRWHMTIPPFGSIASVGEVTRGAWQNVMVCVVFLVLRDLLSFFHLKIVIFQF